MDKTSDLDMIYTPSEDVVVREIEGNLIIVPLVAGMGEKDDEIYTVNETGRAILSRLDGKRRLRKVVLDLSDEFSAPEGEILTDVTGFVGELMNRGMLVSASESRDAA